MLTDALRDEFLAEGYTVVPGVLPPDTLAAIRRTTSSMGEREPSRRSWNERSCFRQAPFVRILSSPVLIDTARALIGEDVQLLQLDLLRIHSDDPAPEWHRDVEFVCNKTLAISMAIYLQDTPEGAGQLRVMPRSHRLDDGPKRTLDALPGQISVPVVAGSAVVHDSTLWHTATKDGPGIDCWTLFPIFGRFWIKRRDVGCPQPPPAAILDQTDPLVRQILGFRLRSGVQPLLGDDDQYNQRGDPGIDFSVRNG
jgi:hypothetical protein